MKKILSVSIMVMLCWAATARAATVTPFSNITSVKIKAGINAVMFGSNPACYDRDIAVTIGLIDYTPGLDPFFVENQLTNDSMVWNTGVGILGPGALTFAYSMTAVIPGADVMVAIPGDPYEFDITQIIQQAAAANDSIPYAICVMSDSGHMGNGGGFVRDSGKINLLARPGINSYADLLGLEAVDNSGTHMYKYKKNGGDYENVLEDRMQWSATHNNYNGQDGPGFAVGGWYGSVAPDTSYKGIAERRCSFIFHRGLAAKLGWHDPLYPNDVFTPAIEKSAKGVPSRLSLKNSPNPFTGITHIAYALDRDASVSLAVYDIAGKLMQTLAAGIQASGSYNLAWDSRQSPMGVYVLRLKAGDKTLNRKMIVIK